MNSLMPRCTKIPSPAVTPSQWMGIVFLAAAVVAAPGSSYGQALANDPLKAQIAEIDPVLGAGSASDPVIARVDGVEILQSDLAMAEEALAKGLPIRDENVKRQNLVNYLTDVIILSRVAQKQNVASGADAQRIERRVEFARNKALMDRLLEITARTAVTDETVRKAYDDAVQKAGTDYEVRLRAILFAFNDVKDDTQVNAAEAKAKAAFERIAAGEDFAAVAKEVSESPSGNQNGGDLGYATRAMMGKEYADVAFDLDIGGVSKPIKTQFGWHLIKVEDKRKRQPAPFEVVRDKFAMLVARNAELALISNLRSQAKIEVIDKPKADEKPAEVAK